MATLNADLLTLTMKTIEESPDTWDQRHWRCNSGMCFAGWVCELSGSRWLVPADQVTLNMDDDSWVPGIYAYMEPSYVIDHRRDWKTLRDGRAGVHVQTRAQRLLGLTEVEADRLFDQDQDLAGLRIQVEWLLRPQRAELEALIEGLA